MKAQPNKPGVPGIDRGERYLLRGSPDKSPMIAYPQRSGTEPEEDWLSVATSDPAFWLKEPDRD